MDFAFDLKLTYLCAFLMNTNQRHIDLLQPRLRTALRLFLQFSHNKAFITLASAGCA